MRKRRRRTFQVEGLETRTLLSVTDHLAPVAAEVAPSKPAAPQTILLSGTLIGRFGLSDANFNAKTVAFVSGSGRVNPMGAALMAGSITGLTGTPGSPLRGSVLLYNTQGALLLALSSVTPISLQGPLSVRVSVLGGNGAFSHLSGQGGATIQVTSIAANGLSGTFNVSLIGLLHRV